MKWLKALWAKLFGAPVVEPIRREVPELMQSWRLSVLLDRLPEWHRLLNLGCQTFRHNTAAAMKMGPLVFPTDKSWFAIDAIIDRSAPLPSLFFVGIQSPKERTDEENIIPTFFVGEKVKVPLHVERLPGDCYYILTDYFLDERHHGWTDAYIFISEGKVLFPRVATTVRTTIRRPDKRGGIKGIPSRQFRRSCDCLGDRGELVLASGVLSAINWWHERTRHWLVVTKRNNKRVSFQVREGQHKYFFKDRDKVVTTPTGKRKTIFHLVSEHLRRTDKKTIVIKEHSRGVRHFFWNGFECHIFAPGWHGRDFLGEMDISGIEHDGPLPDKMLYADEVAEKMARLMEGTSVRKQV